MTTKSIFRLTGLCLLGLAVFACGSGSVDTAPAKQTASGATARRNKK